MGRVGSGHRRKALVVVATVGGSLTMASGASALGVPGGLDPTFGGGSPVLADFAQATPRSSGFSGLVLDSAGRLVANGSATDAQGKSALLVSRYGPAGDRDLGFNGTGMLLQQFGSPISGSASAPFSFSYRGFSLPGGGLGFPVYRSRPEGRIDQAVLAIGANGAPDLNIGSGGLASVQALTAPAALGTSTATATSDGTIYVAGTTLSSAPGFQRKLGLTRFTPQGAVAPFFGSGGTVQLNLSDLDAGGTYPADLIPVAGAKLLVGGTADGADGRGTILLARLSAQNGEPDPSFGTSGGRTTVQARSVGGTDSAGTALAVGPDGSIYQVGYADDADDRSAFTIVRYGPSGNPDPSWGAGGVRKLQLAAGTDPQDRSVAQDVAVQADGKVLVVGSDAHPDGSGAGIVIRLRTDGTLDPSFGTGGVVRLQLSQAPAPRTGIDSAVIVGDRLYVAGSVTDGPATSRGLLASILLAPLPDPPPASAPTPTPGPVVATPGTLVPTVTRLALRKRREIAVPVRCDGAGACTGTLALVSRSGKLVGPLKRRERRAVTYGSTTYSVAARGTATVIVTVTTSARRLIAKGLLKSRISIVPAAGTPSLTNATIRPKATR